MKDMKKNKDEEKKNLDKENRVETKEKEKKIILRKILNIESEDDLKELLDNVFRERNMVKSRCSCENVSNRIFLILY